MTKATKGAPNSNLLAVITQRIEAITAAEKITKVELGLLSRELLLYLAVDTEATDINPVNQLIGVLTPMNKKTCILFFREFLPFKWNDEEGRFAHKIKGAKRLEEFASDATAALAAETWDVWVWAEHNVDVDKKNFDLSQHVTKAVEMAIHGKKESKNTLAALPLNVNQIMAAVVAAGISTDDMMEGIASLPAEAVAGVDTDEEGEHGAVAV